MTDEPLIQKKLARIETCVQELQKLARVHAMKSDVREERFVEHTLQIAIQAAIDVASHVAADERLGEAETNRGLFLLLVRGGWMSEALGDKLGQMAGFRNILVHGYDEIELDIVRDVVEHHLGDLLEFVAAIRSRLTGA